MPENVVKTTSLCVAGGPSDDRDYELTGVPSLGMLLNIFNRFVWPILSSRQGIVGGVKRYCALSEWTLAAICLFAISWHLPAQGADSTTEKPSHAAVRVGVSVPPQRFLLERIAGDLVETTVLVDQGQSPHHYSPSPAKIRALANAEIYFAVGLEEEMHWKEKFLGSNAELKWVEAAKGHHQWLSPTQIRSVVQRMTDQLITLRPSAADALRAGEQSLLLELDLLDVELSEIFDESTRGKTFVANHEAWASLTSNYGLTMLVIHRDGKSPSVRDLAKLISTAQSLSIEWVIADAGHSDKSAQQIAQAIDGKVVMLNPLEESWIENIRQSASVIRGALK